MKSEQKYYQITPQSAHIDILTQLKQRSNVKSEEQKIQLLQQIFNNIENLDEDKLEIDIDNKLCAELNKLIQQEEKYAAQLKIMNIILVISERGSEIVKMFVENKFYWTFKDSGLLDTIEQIFNQQIKLQKEGNASYQYNELYSILVLINSFINKYRFIDDGINEACGNYFKFQINEMIQILRNLIIQKDLEDENRKQQIETELKKRIKIINAISNIAEDWTTQEYLIEQLKIHEDIEPLIHIRCSEELNCSQCLNLPESDSSNQFLSFIYKSLEELSWYENDVRQFLLDNHNIFNHLTPLIISFSTKNSHQTSQQSQIQQNSISSYPESTLSIVAQSLHFLHTLLDENTSLCQLAYSTPNLIKALIDLTIFERKQHQSIKIQKYITNIRIQSNCCLDRISCFGVQIVKERILNDQYIRIQTCIIGSGGGNEEQNDEVIQIGLMNISNLYIINLEEDDEHFHGQPQLLKSVNEQLEYEGGLEEIEANLYHYKQIDQYKVQYLANETKKRMNNIKIYKLNA